MKFCGWFLVTWALISVASAKDPICSLPPYSGSGKNGERVCRARIHAWTFDECIGGCVHYIYGGCFGNDNRFHSEEQCKSVCEDC